MRSLLIIIIVVVVLIAGWFFLRRNHNEDDGPKQKAIAESRHSIAFNKSIDSIMNEYYQLTESFVNWDSMHTKQVAQNISEKLKNFNLTELKKDSSGIEQTASSLLSDVSSSLDSVRFSATINSQRRGLNNVTQNIYDFLRTVRYDHSKLYLQQCPMAFNDEEPGVWLSKTDSIRNPYLGLHHPRYGKGMITCGETKDTLNFMKE